MKELQLKLKAMGGVAASAASGGISEEEAQARVDEAVAAAQAEAEESMTDLLECLGQEETKVERLRWVNSPLMAAPAPTPLQGCPGTHSGNALCQCNVTF